MAEFPSGLSFWWTSLWHGPEGPFKEYVKNTCIERGYSNAEKWTVSTAYGFGAQKTGNLDFHIGNIYEKLSQSLSGYASTKRFAQRAADVICPDKNGGGGTSSGIRGTGQFRNLTLYYSTFEGLQIFLGLRAQLYYQSVYSMQVRMHQRPYAPYTSYYSPQILLAPAPMIYVCP